MNDNVSTTFGTVFSLRKNHLFPQMTIIDTEVKLEYNNFFWELNQKNTSANKPSRFSRFSPIHIFSSIKREVITYEGVGEDNIPKNALRELASLDS